ncbi:hypothetical protein F4804DRAFT_353968 [Jackrogersella minutella]|nr:hypothetical protein F4804DRAFT_353968 [Jackrogersella minutella]
MCMRKRIFFSCYHEDNDVTPPWPLIYCSDAKPSSSDGKPQACSAESTLPLTAKHDFFAGVIRAGLCDACAADARTGTLLFRRPPMPETPALSSSSAYTFTGAGSKDSGAKERKSPPGSIFDFKFDADSHALLDLEKMTSKLTIGDPPAGGLPYSEVGSLFGGTGKDFQLYDDKDEFADELQDIGSKKKGSSSKTS